MGPIPARTSRLFVLVAALSLVLTLLPGSSAAAADRSTCNGAVCAEIIWNGSSVSSWRTTVWAGSGWRCGTARFLVNGGLFQSKYACNYGTITAYANMPLAANQGATYCTYWLEYSGTACITL